MGFVKEEPKTSDSHQFVLDMAERHRPQSAHNIRPRNESGGRHTKPRERQTKQGRAGNISGYSHDFDISRRRQRNKDEQAGFKGSNVDLTNDLFVSDRKGDPDIIRYGSNNSYRVPHYRRIGYGAILGLPNVLKIDRQQSTDKEVVLVDSSGRLNTRNKAIFSKTAKIDEYRVAPVAFDAEDRFRDYISFRHRTGKNNSGSRESSDSSTDDDTTDYRSIKGKAKATDLIDKDLVLNVQNKTSNLQIVSDAEVELQNLVKSEPTNGQAWLNYIERKFSNSTGAKTYAERISHADIKISLYEKALKKVIGSSKQYLLLGLLSEASLIWDRDKLKKKWHDVLQNNQESFVLWKGYLNYVQTSSVRFKLDDLKEIYENCLHIFKNVAKRVHATGIENDCLQVDANVIYLLLRFTTCLRQSGFIEQAVAIWQANLERLMSSRWRSSGVTKEQFESFWESEVARIGEVNALGLDHYLEHGGDAAPEIEDPGRPIDKTCDILQWLAYEEKMSDALPARTMDITDDEDAFRVVLYSDVEPYLVDLFKDSHHIFLDAFFIFNGLPSLWQGISEHWNNDSFLRHEVIDTGLVGRRDSHRPYDLGKLTDRITNCINTVDILFGGNLPLSSDEEKPQISNTASRWPKRSSLAARLDWVHNVIKQLADRATITDRRTFLQYYLSFELRYFPQQVRRTSKSILKANAQDLVLYNAYGLIEFRLGNSASAVKVLRTAMTMRPHDPDVILLKRTLIWQALEANQTSEAINALLEDSKSQGEAALLEAQKSLLSGRDKAMSDATKRYLLTAYIDCLVLLSYLSNPDALQAAQVVFESNLSYILDESRYEGDGIEIMHQNMARLLLYHMSRYHYKPAMVRGAMERSILAFPTNTIFLELWQMNERRYRAYDRVRSVMNDILSGSHWRASTGKGSALVEGMFAISTEIHRAAALDSGAESIRSAFERALSDRETEGSPVIWSYYISFELGRDEARSRAKNVIARSIVACPWVLNFHLLAIGNLKNEEERKTSDSLSELKGYYDTIVDRELRLHKLRAPQHWK